MVRVSGKDAEVFYNAQDLSGQSNRFTLNVENDNFDVTSFSDAAKTFVEGNYGWSIDLATFWIGDDGASDAEKLLVANLGGGAKAMTVAPEGTTSNTLYSGNVFITSFSVESPVDGAVTLSASFQGSGALTRAQGGA
jgi:predicted secreted protein